jgi:nucleoside-diphosphate-sugar epimerase
VHQATAIPEGLDLRHFDRSFALTSRLRSEGTDNLLAAARAAAVPRLIAQSYTGWPNARTGGPVKTEDDPLDPAPPAPMGQALEAIRHLESAVTSAAGIEGVVLRYGSFYGPGTSIGPASGQVTRLVRQRRLPVVGGGGGIWSFTHIDDAATATVAALERGRGVYNIVDDDPAPVVQWLPRLAAALGAKPPRRIPAWLARRSSASWGWR